MVVVVVIALLAFGVGHIVGRRAGSVYEIISATATEAQRLAFVREAPCAAGRCQTLWIGNTRDDATQVGELSPSDRAEEIAWAPDGYRMGFVINGYQLRIFDGQSRTLVGQVNLLEPDATLSSRIARGVTFSSNGAAVTFDDCPRYKSGCKSGLVAVR